MLTDFLHGERLLYLERSFTNDFFATFVNIGVSDQSVGQ